MDKLDSIVNMPRTTVDVPPDLLRDVQLGNVTPSAARVIMGAQARTAPQAINLKLTSPLITKLRDKPMATYQKRQAIKCEEHGRLFCYLCSLNPSWCAPWLKGGSPNTANTPCAGYQNGYQVSGMHVKSCPYRIPTKTYAIKHMKDLLSTAPANAIVYACDWEGQIADIAWQHTNDEDSVVKTLWHLRSWDEKQKGKPGTCMGRLFFAKKLVELQMHIEPVWFNFADRELAPNTIHLHPVYQHPEEHWPRSQQYVPQPVSVITGVSDGVLVGKSATIMQDRYSTSKPDTSRPQLGDLAYNIELGLVQIVSADATGIHWEDFAMVKPNTTYSSNSLIAGNYASKHALREDVIQQVLAFMEEITVVHDGVRYIRNGHTSTGHFELRHSGIMIEAAQVYLVNPYIANAPLDPAYLSNLDWQRQFGGTN